MDRAARDAAIVAAYTTQPDLSQAELARLFGIQSSQVSRVIARAGATDPARNSIVRRRMWREGVWANADRSNVGRKGAWPECPPDIKPQYDHLVRVKKIPAPQARAMLEGRR